MSCCCGDREPVAIGVAMSNNASRIEACRDRKPIGLRARCVMLGQWAAPLVALALVPKCPACVAAYILLFTGVGLSMPVAAAVRWSLIAICFAALGMLLFRKLRRALAAGQR